MESIDYLHKIGFLQRIKYNGLIEEIEEQLRYRRQAPEVIKGYQLGRIQAIVNYAFVHVPFYHSLYKTAGFQPGDLKSWDDFRKLPVANSEALRESFSDWSFLKNHPDRKFLIDDSTSGSSGRPFVFYKDSRLLAREHLSLMIQKLLLGWKFTDRELYVKGLIQKLAWKENILDFFDWHTYRIDGFDISRRNIEDLVRFIRKKKISFFYGYPTSLLRLCRAASEHGVKLPARLTITVGEVLTESLRSNLEDCLQGSVYQLYGAAECMQVAHECSERQGMHVDANRYYLELKSSNVSRNGYERGSMLITDFDNRVMPIIRYEIGDIVNIDYLPCGCGNNCPRISSVEGKVYEVIKTPAGTELNLHILLDDIFSDHAKFISQFQAVAEKPDLLKIYIVPGQNGIPEDLRENLRKQLQSYAGESMKVKLQDVSYIPRDGSGKQKKVIDWRIYYSNGNSAKPPEKLTI